MRPASLLTVLLLSVVAITHLLRLIFQTEILVAGAVVPMWVSIAGVLVPGALAVALCLEAKGIGADRAA